MKDAYIVLEDGQVFKGKRFGSERDVIGEVVFTTGMTGYNETLSDPSYYGQIVMQTFPTIGNYGLITKDFESDGIYVSGYIVRELCDTPSNFRSEGRLGDYLEKAGIPGICGVDTRRLTSVIREKGVMNACICSDPSEADAQAIRAYTVHDAVRSVSSGKKQHFSAEKARCSVALIDYGAKENIIRSLLSRGCDVTVWPAFSTAEEILASEPDGIMLSNGPGDPKENVFCIEQIKKLCGKKPIFGICLGHQLLALACGGDTVKLKYGHRGANQPVTELSSGHTVITTQNHGYAVVSESIPAETGRVSFVNANDGTCEGAEYTAFNAFSVQFHPEACAGPLDTSVLFDRFVGLLV